MLANEFWIAAMLSGLSISAALAQGIAAGKTSFRICRACHSIDVGAQNKVGPPGTANFFRYQDETKARNLWSYLRRFGYESRPQREVLHTGFCSLRSDRSSRREMIIRNMSPGSSQGRSAQSQTLEI
jgi:cytochrome c2